MQNRCVFFDRDGIVNVSPGPGYVERWGDFHLVPEFVAAARLTLERGYGLAIITNQRGVARGIMSQKTLDEIHAKLVAVLKEQGIELLGIYCCTHERDSCACRKPQPGLLLQAAKEHDIDLDASWMVGDKETDVEAGRRAGCKTMLVDGSSVPTDADVRVPDMAGLPGALERCLMTTT